MAETRVERRLAAILAAEVAGYSRLMAADEEGQILERAIALSSSYAKAHSLLAFAHVRRVCYGTGSIEACVPIARDHVRKALRRELPSRQRSYRRYKVSNFAQTPSTHASRNYF